MNRNVRLGAVLLLLTRVGAPSPAAAAGPAEFSLDTSFTYQGRLQRQGAPAEGVFDLSFELYDAREGGASLGRLDRFDVPIREGAFAAELDFGHSVYSGDPVWLEIHVRPAGEGSYTALEPRHRLAGEGVSSCTVDSDVLINGTLDIDPVGAEVALDVTCCNEADLGGGGQIQLFGFLQSLGIDNSEIQSRSLGAGAPFSINPEGGNVGIGTPGTPQAPLQLPSGPDAEPGSGGALVIGSTAGTNLAFDGNEIMARNDGAVSALYLNNDGGDVVLGGYLDIGLQLVTTTSDLLTVDVDCPTGKYLLSGSCGGGAERIKNSYPLDSNTWRCSFDGGGVNRAFAICAQIRW